MVGKRLLGMALIYALGAPAEVAAIQVPQRYNVVSFGANGFLPLGLNNAGEIVGSTGFGGFRWSLQNGLLATGPYVGYAIADNGASAGQMRDSAPFVATFQAPSGVTSPLTNMPSAAFDMNANGTIVGGDYRSNSFRAFIYDTVNGYRIFDEAQHANAINGNGHVVGWAGVSGTSSMRAVRYSANDGWTELSPGVMSIAYDINDAGVVVGASIISGVWRPTIWQPNSQATVLNGLSGFSFTSVNNDGWALLPNNSTCAPSLYHANTGEISILPLIDPVASVSQICSPVLNNLGQIAAYGIVNGEIRAMLLLPEFGPGGGGNAVPEPASWAMLIAGFGLVGAAMRRKGASTVLRRPVAADA
jgi:hypothetical protein